MFALLKQVRTPPVRPADGVVECVYESFVPGEDYRGLGLRGRTLSRPLSASVCGKYVVAATRPSPFKVGDNQRPERTMSGAAKTPPESSVPGDNLTGGSRRNQLRRGRGSPPVLSEVPHELSIPMRTPKSANGPRSNSFRPDSPSGHPPTGDGRLSHPPHHTGHGPFRTRPPTSVKSPFT